MTMQSRGQAAAWHSAQLGDPSHGDLTLIVNEKHTFFDHRALLAVWSPVWSSMLSNGMKETSQTTVHLREDDDKHAEHFGTFLDFMYPYSPIIITRENVDALLHLADKYQVQARVNQACEAFLLTLDCDPYASRELLRKGQQFGLRELTRKHAMWLGRGVGRNPPLEEMNAEALRSCLDGALAEMNVLHQENAKMKWQHKEIAEGINRARLMTKAHVVDQIQMNKVRDQLESILTKMEWKPI